MIEETLVPVLAYWDGWKLNATKSVRMVPFVEREHELWTPEKIRLEMDAMKAWGCVLVPLSRLEDAGKEADKPGRERFCCAKSDTNWQFRLMLAPALDS